MEEHSPNTKSENDRQWRQNNAEHIREYRNAYYHKNKLKISEQNKQSYQSNKQKSNARSRAYRRDNLQKIKDHSKLYRTQNKEKVAAQNKRDYEKNKEKRLRQQKEYNIANKEKIAARKAERKEAKGPPRHRPYITPKQYSNEEVEHMVDRYKNQLDPLWCPLTDKSYATHQIWVAILSTMMVRPCVNHFMFLLQDPHYSQYSGALLTEEDYSYVLLFRGWKGFSKYTKEERDQKIWKKNWRNNRHRDEECRKKMSEMGKAFSQTAEGIQIRKEKSERMKAFYQTEEGKKQKKESGKKTSVAMKRLIKEGKFTPPITNTWTHWDAKIVLEDGIVRKFRSSWEACFFYSNSHMHYESIRVRSSTEERTYISDFFDANTNTMYEIKPRGRYNPEINKMTDLLNYCLKNSLKFVWVNESNLLSFVDVDKLTNDPDNVDQFKKMIKDPTMRAEHERNYPKNQKN